MKHASPETFDVPPRIVSSSTTPRKLRRIRDRKKALLRDVLGARPDSYIAQRIGCASNTVRNMRRSLGLPGYAERLKSGPTEIPTDAQIDEAIREYLRKMKG